MLKTKQFSSYLQLADVVNTFTHNGLTSPQSNPSDSDKKGVVFLVRNKHDFAQKGSVKGFIVTSKETLAKQLPYVSHWTPNVYCYGKYTDKNRTLIKGFTEANLQQINAFVFEIDNKRLTINEILLICHDNGIGIPTMIVESDRGYHIYFALEKPVFINARNLNKFKEIKALASAKRVANNLKSKLHDLLGVDRDCNSFGFFRAPNSSNIVWFSKEMVYPYKHFMNLSMDYESDKYIADLNDVKFVKKSSSTDFLNWLQPILNNNEVRGEKGQIGRNNLFFTVALAFKAEGRSLEDAYDCIDQINTDLVQPLKDSEVQTIVRSAFYGKCKGPKNEYIQYLSELYGNGQEYKQLQVKGWYKFKKARTERVRSHYNEWEDDIIRFIKSEIKAGETFIWYTQKQLCEKLNIPSSSLNEVLKKTNKIVKIVTGKGRAAQTGWSTISVLLQVLKDRKSAYAKYLWDIQNSLQFMEKNTAYYLISDIVNQFVEAEQENRKKRRQINVKEYLHMLSIANE